ncbi:uncharacterized protein LOC100908298 [Galendromus occidentalis]|uniref:Uncharacterized protein LOC100908298 n=1 Tax=Galendromus occidentalis TaxID=34638 RepID=A0AAJ7L7X6_9ACAR|nr:uncharacterized protein LOC100908298 [Galendromus occidentalis]
MTRPPLDPKTSYFLKRLIHLDKTTGGVIWKLYEDPSPTSAVDANHKSQPGSPDEGPELRRQSKERRISRSPPSLEDCTPQYSQSTQRLARETQCTASEEEQWRAKIRGDSAHRSGSSETNLSATERSSRPASRTSIPDWSDQEGSNGSTTESQEMTRIAPRKTFPPEEYSSRLPPDSPDLSVPDHVIRGSIFENGTGGSKKIRARKNSTAAPDSIQRTRRSPAPNTEKEPVVDSIGPKAPSPPTPSTLFSDSSEEELRSARTSSTSRYVPSTCHASPETILTQLSSSRRRKSPSRPPVPVPAKQPKKEEANKESDTSRESCSTVPSVGDRIEARHGIPVLPAKKIVAASQSTVAPLVVPAVPVSPYSGSCTATLGSPGPRTWSPIAENPPGLPVQSAAFGTTVSFHSRFSVKNVVEVHQSLSVAQVTLRSIDATCGSFAAKLSISNSAYAQEIAKKPPPLLALSVEKGCQSAAVEHVGSVRRDLIRGTEGAVVSKRSIQETRGSLHYRSSIRSGEGQIEVPNKRISLANQVMTTSSVEVRQRVNTHRETSAMYVGENFHKEDRKIVTNTSVPDAIQATHGTSHSLRTVRTSDTRGEGTVTSPASIATTVLFGARLKPIKSGVDSPGLSSCMTPSSGRALPSTSSSKRSMRKPARIIQKNLQRKIQGKTMSKRPSSSLSYLPGLFLSPSVQPGLLSNDVGDQRFRNPSGGLS